MRTHLRFKASILLVVFLFQIFSPNHLLALTSGPSQPEMASFTPAGVTQMVDPFSGDFSYNIPLLEVDGYPVNIAYNSGVGMEQEASWVGLGWNLNVGTINRSVRGLPDDFKGEEIETTTHMKDMVITKVGGGIGVEVFGENSLGGNIGANLAFIHNSYKGFGVELGASMGPSLEMGGLRANSSLGFSLNSLDGASFNSSLGVSLSALNSNGSGFTFGGNMGSGYNTRTGQKMRSFGTTAGYRYGKSKVGGENNKKRFSGSYSSSSTYLPVGLETYTPYPSTQMESKTTSFSGSVGGEVPVAVNLNVSVHGSRTVQSVANHGINNKPAYGYLYSEAADEEALLDFNRDKSAVLNKTISNLPPTNFTYDVYSVSGQGVSGTFRPFRNEIANLSDPNIASTNSSSNEFGVEVGLGAIFHGGGNFNATNVTSEYGAWVGGSHSSYSFKSKEINSPFESVYFKAAGELTESDVDYFENKLAGTEAIAFKLSGMNTLTELDVSDGTTLASLDENYDERRKPRAKHFAYYTAEEVNEIEGDDFIHSYDGEYYPTAGSNGLDVQDISRVSSARKAHHIAKIEQTNPNGERYVFGIAAYNNSKVEMSYRTDESPTDGKVQVETGESAYFNNTGKDGYYSKKVVPAYAHSYLLTEKQSADYRDITGNGPSMDDQGQAWEFNYTRKEADFQWRTPYEKATYMEGYKTDDHDQMASYSYGSKEMWYLHSIESNNKVAEFKVSERLDGVEAAKHIDELGDDDFNMNGGLPTSYSSAAKSYRLDTIFLFDKEDRLKNRAKATPIKTIVFKYGYSLCSEIENTVSGGANDGKLTLESIEISYGGTTTEPAYTISPYQFKYGYAPNNDPLLVENPSYNPNNVDRWGNYKETSDNPSNLGNDEFPYSTQNRANADKWAASWNLTQIITPTSGKITIEYEADDYSYVQDRKAMRMYPVVGAGTNGQLSTLNTLYNKKMLYIKKPNELNGVTDGEVIKKALLGPKGEMPNMYFKFKLSLKGNNPVEYVSGYVDVIDLGISSNNPNYLWVQLKDVSPNPISKAAWGFYRQNLFNQLYDQPSINDSRVEALIKGIAANKEEIKRMFTGVENDLKNRNVANYFEPEESFIRLNVPYSKIGGGARVAEIKIHDRWSEMVADGTDATYGKVYEYTTTDENGHEISSGVASYEPMIGNDENPFRMPAPYLAQQSAGHIPAIKDYQETPFGETFFPSPSVGYSKVKVRNIHYDKGMTANSITEHQFYTAKDFPVIVKETDLEMYNSPSPKAKVAFPFRNQTNRSEFAASQGYAIILNDMHGKPMTERTYTKQLINGEEIEKVVSGSKYNYRYKSTNYGKELDNVVEVLGRDGYVKEKLLGVEYDICIDSRKSYEASETATKKANADIIPGIPPFSFIPLINPDFKTIKDIKESRSVVVTKVIQQYGIIESVENYTDQYATTTYNRMYDGHTGEVLLTETQDEHQANEFQFSIPAYHTPDLQRMGGSYENHGVSLEVKHETRMISCFEQDVSGNNLNSTYQNTNMMLSHGDKVFIHSNNGTTNRVAWVDVDFDIFDSQGSENGKDGLFSVRSNETDCSYWEVYLYDHTPIRSGTNIQLCTNASNNNPPGSIRSSDMSNRYLGSTVEVFLPNQQVIDFFLSPTGGVNNYDPGYYQDFCMLDTKLLDNWGDFAYGAFAIDTINGSFFNLNESYVAKVEYPNNNETIFKLSFDLDIVEQSEELSSILFNQSDWQLSGLFLIKTEIKYNNQVQPFYRLLPYRTKGVGFFFDKRVFNPALSGLVSRNPNYDSPCPFTFRLVDRAGAYINNLQEGDLVRVIRSGNRNMLDAKEGKIVATTNPVNVDANGKFLGVKLPGADYPEMEVLQVSAQQYSDDYDLSVYTQNEGNYNKFLVGSDGNFRIQKTKKYRSPRYQNHEEVESAVDGYLTALPDLWQAIPEDCVYGLTSPLQSATSGWFDEEVITKYGEGGQSLEAKNHDLDIYSSVILNPFNQTEVVASNSKQKNIAVENFENYYNVSQSYYKESHFKLLKAFGVNPSPLSYSLDLDEKYYRYHNLGENDKLLVKGPAHTGDYSILVYNDEFDNQLSRTLTYSEEAARYLSNVELGESVFSGAQTATVTASERDDFHALIEDTYNDDEWTDIDLALKVLQRQQTFTVYNSSSSQGGFKPDQGRYLVSIWVRDLASVNVPYYGESPAVQVSTNSGVTNLSTVQSPIDGWFKMEAEFDYDGSSNISLTLDGGLFGACFDDVRIQPVESNIKTYVYDRRTKQLKAELDENNFATFYRYDATGSPTHVNKETPSGILTISESRRTPQ